MFLTCLACSGLASWMRPPVSPRASVLDEPITPSAFNEYVANDSEPPEAFSHAGPTGDLATGRILNRTFRVAKGAIHGDFISSCAATHSRRVAGDKTLEADTYLDLSFGEDGQLGIRYHDDVGSAAGTVRYDYAPSANNRMVQLTPFRLEGTGSEGVALGLLKEKYSTISSDAVRATQVVNFPQGLNVVVRLDRSNPAKIKSLVIENAPMRVTLVAQVNDKVCQADWSLVLTATLE